MFCPKCGNQISEGVKFCPKCGNQIGEGLGSSNLGGAVGGSRGPQSKGQAGTDAAGKIESLLSAYVQNWKGLGTMVQEKKLLWLGCHGAAVLVLFVAFVLVVILAVGIRRNPIAVRENTAREDTAQEDTAREDVVQESQEADPNVISAMKAAGIEDRVIEWGDSSLAESMRRKTGIEGRDIMLSDVWEITELSFAHSAIINISGLSNLPNLRKLDLNYTRVSDISALSSLTNLEWLDLSDTQVSDISVLYNLTNLTYLNLARTPVSKEDKKALKESLGIDIEGVNLEGVNIWGSQSEDVNPITGIRKDSNTLW